VSTAITEVDRAEVAQVDITELTPTEVAKRLVVLNRHLYAKVNELQALGKEAADARKRAKVAYAEAFLSAQGNPMDVRKQIAELAAADAKFEADVAEQMVSACKEALKAMHAAIDVGRSLSATSRDEMRLAGVGQP
jgi:hypothetical protein